MAPVKEAKTKKRVTKTAEVKAEPKEKTQAKSALEIPVYGLDGKEAKTIALSEAVFGLEENPRLVAQYVRVYLANQRQGTASTKLRGEVVGTTKKVYRQKGTGNARHGSMKAPIFVGGGVTGGPKPKDHSLKMNKKQKRLALLTVLSSKAKEGAIAALGQDVMSMEAKTKTFSQLLQTIGAKDMKTMLITAQANDGLKLSARNISSVELVSTSNLNPYSLLTKKKILFTEDALGVLTSLYTQK